MSRPIAKTARVPWIAWALFAVVLGGLLLLFSFIANLDKQARRRGFKAPDDVQAARELLADAAAEVEKIIAKLTQPAASRVTGMDHVNVLQLNLALDELR